jgi:hypothetical protein
MRKLFSGAMIGALFLVLAAVAMAVTDTMKYSSVTKVVGKAAAAKKPANLSYRGTIAINTEPAEQQPDAAPRTTVSFDKNIINNAKYYPSCTQAEIDGKEALPEKCKKAIVSIKGKSTATAYAGTPGNPKAQSVKEELTVEAINGPKGKTLFLVVSSKPNQAVTLNNRVVPGTVLKGKGLFGFLVQFDIPTDLQEQLGLKISLTDFDVHVDGKPRAVKIGGKSAKVAYLQLKACPKTRKLNVKAATQFRDNATGTIKTVESVSTSKC